MKRIIAIFGAAAFVLTGGGAAAQDRIVVDQRVMLDNVEVERVGNEIMIDFDVRANGRELRRNEAVMLTPKLGGVDLPEIMVNGSHRGRAYRREQTLKGRNADPQPGLMMSVRPHRTAVAHYTKIVPFVPSMEGADVEVESYVANCCRTTSPVLSKIIREIPVVQPGKRLSGAEIAGLVSWLEPQEEVVKRRETSLTANITYPQGATDVRWDYDTNASELSRIDRILKPLLDEPTYNVTDVRIDGYASIEGQWDTNERLSKMRAESFRMWLTSRYQNIRNVAVNARGEDWDGLLEMVKEDPGMPSKWGVISIIENVGIFNGREKQLMDLAQGVPYKYMYRYFFPRLRRMEITFGYDVEAFEGRKAHEVMSRRPEDLSQAEMLRTLREQRTDELEMYRRIAAQFPNDHIALINASSAEMVAGNLAEAWKYLERVQNDPRAANNTTIYKMLSTVAQ